MYKKIHPKRRGEGTRNFFPWEEGKQKISKFQEGGTNLLGHYTMELTFFSSISREK